MKTINPLNGEIVADYPEHSDAEVDARIDQPLAALSSRCRDAQAVGPVDHLVGDVQRGVIEPDPSHRADGLQCRCSSSLRERTMPRAAAALEALAKTVQTGSPARSEVPGDCRSAVQSGQAKLGNGATGAEA